MPQSQQRCVCVCVLNVIVCPQHNHVGNPPVVCDFLLRQLESSLQCTGIIVFDVVPNYAGTGEIKRPIVMNKMGGTGYQFEQVGGWLGKNGPEVWTQR